jgi:membrane protease YdiL (CAAX protease family)
MPFFESHLVTILGVGQFATVLYALLAVRLRFGKQGLRDLGFQRPWGAHWLLVVLLMFPLWLLCSMLQGDLFEWFPESRRAMQQLFVSISQAPLSVLVLIIGFGPAIGEELLFRGLIGRGLVARQGLIRGILWTSILFGVMHLNPGQALAVIPIGLAMHFVYYTTRSFWAPMTLHLLNNSLSVLLLKNSSHPTVQTISRSLEAPGTHHLPMLVASVAMVTAIVILLWQTRVQFVLPDGTVWNPGYTTTAAPPPELNAVPVWQEPRLLMLAGGTFNSLGFAAGVWRLADWAGLPW